MEAKYQLLRFGKAGICWQSTWHFDKTYSLDPGQDLDMSFGDFRQIEGQGGKIFFGTFAGTLTDLWFDLDGNLKNFGGL